MCQFLYWRFKRVARIFGQNKSAKKKNHSNEMKQKNWQIQPKLNRPQDKSPTISHTTLAIRLNHDENHFVSHLAFTFAPFSIDLHTGLPFFWHIFFFSVRLHCFLFAFGLPLLMIRMKEHCFVCVCDCVLFLFSTWNTKNARYSCKKNSKQKLNES